tara:strand:+ start:446 stop:865 length:420 start_codon:yes stop_codon:yes gene_type:complete
MFDVFNLANWPLVIIELNYLNTNKEFDDFLLRWEKLYQSNTYFTVVIDTRNLKNIGMTNAYSGSKFILKMREKSPQYLQDTVLIYNDSYVYYLLKLAFSIQSPFSNVFLYNCPHTNIIEYLELFNNRNKNADLVIVKKA